MGYFFLLSARITLLPVYRQNRMYAIEYIRICNRAVYEFAARFDIYLKALALHEPVRKPMPTHGKTVV